MLAAALATGCSRYPRVTDGEGIRFIGALRTACSSKSLGRLDKAASAIQAARAAGGITDAELAAFTSIIETARKGQWKEVEMAAYHFQ
ncbi:MAG TPA: hypothetical protein VGE52_06330, partial [Pirellulales bacterium]